MTLGSVAPTIINAATAEDYLGGRKLTDDTITVAAALAASAATPIDDVRGPAAYRAEMVEVMTRRALVALRDGRDARTGRPTRPCCGATPGGAFPTGPAYAFASFGPGHAIEATVIGRAVSAPGVGKTLMRWLREEALLTDAPKRAAPRGMRSLSHRLPRRHLPSRPPHARRPAPIGRRIVTVEGWPATRGCTPSSKPSSRPAVQCGYCIPGFPDGRGQLLDEKPAPDP
ncbi:MAG: hypothetical protein IPH95_04860 [Candidatus Promineofilum sp.]|nr:hypothetical protein [Promineifilum sp.]